MIQASKRSHRQSGTALFVATTSFIFLIPMIGLAVDVGFLYTIKAKLQASVDGASLAAARALSLGASASQQATSAKNNAVNWFYANFPPTGWGTTGTLMTTSDTYVHVYDDTTNPNLRHVDVYASTNVPTLFMRWFGANATLVAATGYASRRDVNAMMVLDRSGSMCPAGKTPCSTTAFTPNSCASMITAAKTFTGQFAATRDKIGLISFASNSYLHHIPSTDFQTTLGYSNSFGSANGELDTIVCNGGTGSPGAIALAYNELYKIAQPGALNLVVFETDGKPNEVVTNQWDGTTAGILNSSNCTDVNGRKKGGSPAGFTTLASLRSWTAGHSMNTGGSGYMSNIPAGIIGGVGGYDTGTNIGILWNPWLAAKIGGSDPYNESATFVSSASAPGCAFGSTHTANTDLAWLPTTDVYGTSLLDNSYNSITLSGGKIPVSMANIRSASFNAVSNEAYNFRTNATLPVYFFTVGFSAGVDHVILQRVANDPAWLSDTACTSSGDCVNYTNQPQGTYAYASSTSQLMSAFLSLSSQILRLSR